MTEAPVDDRRARSQLLPTRRQEFRPRVFGLALGDKDLNDHDRLRHDPVMAILAGKLEAGREDFDPVGRQPATFGLVIRRVVAPRGRRPMMP